MKRAAASGPGVCQGKSSIHAPAPGNYLVLWLKDSFLSSGHPGTYLRFYMTPVPPGTSRDPLPILPFYSVSYQAVPPRLRAGATRALTFTEVMESCEVLLLYAARHRCPYWVLDRRTGPNEEPPELHNWMQDDYFPRVRAVLGQQPQVAFLVTPAELALLQQQRAAFPQDWHTLSINFGWFTQLPAAEAWLQAQHGSGTSDASFR